MVDEDSLADNAGPVRMLFHSHAPDRLPKSVLLFANLRGFRIGVTVELAKDAAVPQMGEPSKKDDGDHKDDDKTQTEDQSQSDCHWKRRSGKEKEKGGDTGASGMPVGNSRAAAPLDACTPPHPEALLATPPPVLPKQDLHKVYQKKIVKKPGTKSSVGSSSVPLPSARDESAPKPASAPAKVQVQPIPFNQYGSNLEGEGLFSSEPILQPEAISMTIILDDDSPPESQVPIDPNVFKRSKLSAGDRADVGWEGPENWDYDSETLAEKIAKLKKKQDGEVDNPPASSLKIDLAKEVAASAQVSKAKRSVAVVSPISGSHSSSRARGSEAEPILQKAIKRAAAKSGMSSPPISQFLAFSSTPNMHFMGVVGDCGLSLGDGFSSPSPSALLSVIRAKEVAQAKLAEAIEASAQQVRQQAADAAAASLSEEPTSAVGTSAPLTQEVPPAEDIGNPDDILVASLKRQKKQKVPRVALPPRTNLRATPARQARALAKES
jgi:hypothetical protein